MLMYAQQIRRIPGTNYQEAIVDVESMDSLADFRGRYSPGIRPLGRSRSTSMIKFRFETKGQSGMREGTWYDLPEEVWGDARYREVKPSEAGSAFLHAVVEVENSNIHFPTYRTSQNYAEVTTITSPTNLFNISQTDNPIRLEVVDCGHANWNQIYFSDGILIYDTGACQSYTRKDVRDLVRKRAIAKEILPVYVIISHWDIDHYQALQRFTIKELQKISCIYVPSQVPNTATYKRIKARLDCVNVPIQALQPATKLKHDRTIELLHFPSPAQLPSRIQIFRASTGQSRNQTGIALGIVGAKKNALLTGDHHYPKLIKITNHLSQANPLVLVVPHHGGHAGKLDPQEWLKVFSKIETPISCGKNNWNHPYSSVLRNLSLMQGNKRPKLTKTIGTQTFLL